MKRWVIIYPSGRIMFHTVSMTRREVIERVAENKDNWKALQNDGFQARKITITVDK